MAKVSDYQIAEKGFELFCIHKGFKLLDFRSNYKNRSQYIGTCCDEVGKEQYYLITKNGNYYKRISKGNWILNPHGD